MLHMHLFYNLCNIFANKLFLKHICGSTSATTGLFPAPQLCVYVISRLSAHNAVSKHNIVLVFWSLRIISSYFRQFLKKFCWFFCHRHRILLKKNYIKTQCYYFIISSIAQVICPSTFWQLNSDLVFSRIRYWVNTNNNTIDTFTHRYFLHFSSNSHFWKHVQVNCSHTYSIIKLM